MMIYTELFSEFFAHKDLLVRDCNIYKIEHYNPIGVLILLQNLLSNVTV